MATINELVAQLSEVAANPTAELDRHIAAGKKVIGVGPYYVPEELVYAAGGVPFGVWGRMGTATEARKYFPPFYCSLCQMTLEMGLNHELDKLSGFMTAALCDTQRGFSQNFRVGVSQVPMIFVSQPQNRATKAGHDYAVSSYRELKTAVGEACDAIIDDADLSAAIRLYNEWRAEMRTFVKLAGERPALISVSARNDVVNAGYYMDKAEHLKMVRELNAALAELPESTAGYRKVVLSGVYEDIPAIASILEDNKIAVVADDLAKESRAFARQVPEEGDPIEALADGWCGLRADTELYDPKKEHIDALVQKAQDSGADAVIILLAKFCDPEEFEAPLATRAIREAGLKCITVEIDQSTESYEQARTQVQTLAELIG